MICPDCEMYYTEWHYTEEQSRAMMCSTRAISSPLIPHIHVCPEPYPYETARNLCISLGSGGAIVSPTMKARIVLGLKRGIV